MNKYRINWLFFLNNRGEVDGDDAGDKGGDTGGEAGKTFTQADLDRVVQDRLARERSKYQDYEDLRKFRDQYEQSKSVEQQKQLEEAKKYDEAKANYDRQMKELQGKLSEKDQLIQNKEIDFALTREITQQNGFLEETLAMLKGKAVYKDGRISVVMPDDNGLDTELSPAEGVKRFLSKRPHLVKANQAAGGGTGDGAGSGSANQGAGAGDTLQSLNIEIAQAMNVGNYKKAEELKVKLRSALKDKGVSGY